MYNIYYKNNEESMPVINIEGKLDSVDDIARILAEINATKKDRTEKEPIIINLSKTKSISEICLKMFKRLQHIYNLEFQNFSFYIRLQLLEFDLIGSEEEKDEGKGLEGMME